MTLERRQVDFNWMLSAFGVNVELMWSGCQVDVEWMLSGCGVDVEWMWSGCDEIQRTIKQNLARGCF